MKSNLFNNPMIESAKNALPPEQLERYKKLGEDMFSNDFTNLDSNFNNIPPFLAQPLLYISEAIKSGLHPSELTDDEKNILFECYGKNWWERFGYDEKDLHEYYSLTHNFKINPTPIKNEDTDIVSLFNLMLPKDKQINNKSNE